MFDPRLNAEQKAAQAEQTALAIENQIRELEEFESQSAKFLGQDDFFDEEISDIKETKRFITSQEVRLLLTSFLRHGGHVNHPAFTKKASARTFTS